jgi:hypothetical protein
MKNRFAGVITVTAGDYTETCAIKEKSSKGKAHFLKCVRESFETILKTLPKDSKVKVTYYGDFARLMYEELIPSEARMHGEKK